MTAWYNFCRKAKWNSPHELKADLGNESILKNNRVVFTVCGNKYRIIVLTDYLGHGMTLPMIKRLHEGLKIPYESLIR